MPDPDEIQSRVEDAIDELLRKDPLLFRREVSEWAVAHRLGLYLEDKFPSWDVDCEFNRQIFERQGEHVSDTKKIDADTRRPDIIVHERGDPRNETSGENLLIIEMKVNTDSDGDVGNIEDAIDELGYSHGVFVDFYSNPTTSEDWDPDDLEWRSSS